MDPKYRPWIYAFLFALASYIYFPIVFVFLIYFSIRKSREYIGTLPQAKDIPWWGWAVIHGLFLFTLFHFAYKPAYKIAGNEFFYHTRVFKHVVSMVYLKSPFIFLGIFGPVLAYEWRALLHPHGKEGSKAPVLLLVAIPNAIASAFLFMAGMGYSINQSGWVFMHSMASVPLTVLISLSWIYSFENRKRFGF